MKFITENVFKVIFKTKDHFNDWQCYSANTIEEAIAMCREERPDCMIYSAEYTNKTKRKYTKTITEEV